MKISPIQVSNTIKSVVVAAPLLLTAQLAGAIKNSHKADTFEKTTDYTTVCNDKWEMSPKVKVAGENVYPAIVIDKSENALYFYDLETYLDTVYTVNLSKTNQPASGLRVITEIENNKDSDNAESQIIKLGIVDTKTGEISDYNGGIIKGESISDNQSKIGVQMKSDDIKNLANCLFEGQYVLIKK